jgi:hypothetical protein
VHTGINDLSGKIHRRDNHRKKILWRYDLFKKIHRRDNDQKSLVTNYGTLTTAEASYSALEADHAAADKMFILWEPLGSFACCCCRISEMCGFSVIFCYILLIISHKTR